MVAEKPSGSFSSAWRPETAAFSVSFLLLLLVLHAIKQATMIKVSKPIRFFVFINLDVMVKIDKNKGKNFLMAFLF
jgi:hypothetical protein